MYNIILAASAAVIMSPTVNAGAPGLDFDSSILDMSHVDNMYLTTPEGWTLFQGDLLLTYPQMGSYFGFDFADSLMQSGYIFPPIDLDGIEASENRAVELTGRWPEVNRFSNGKIYIPYEIDEADYSNFQDSLSTLIGKIVNPLNTLAADTQMFQFINYAEWAALNAAGANIPNHFIRFENLTSCYSRLGKSSDSNCVCDQCQTCQRLSLRHTDNAGSCLSPRTVIHGE